jgi:hypothetical protein
MKPLHPINIILILFTCMILRTKIIDTTDWLFACIAYIAFMCFLHAAVSAGEK